MQISGYGFWPQGALWNGIPNERVGPLILNVYVFRLNLNVYVIERNCLFGVLNWISLLKVVSCQFLVKKRVLQVTLGILHPLTEHGAGPHFRPCPIRWDYRTIFRIGDGPGWNIGHLLSTGVSHWAKAFSSAAWSQYWALRWIGPWMVDPSEDHF